MSPLTIEPLHAEFGARITGVDLAEPLDDATVEAVCAAIDEYAFLCFPEQPFDDARQLAFTRRLGEPEPNHVKLGQEGVIEYFGTIGNVKADGSKHGNRDKHTVFQTGNNMWHSDSSFREVPTLVSIMCAYEVPAEGGLTEFVSQRAAYDRLPDETRQEIEPLVAIHDYVFSRSKVAPDAVTPSHAASLPPVRQKLVRRNPRTAERNFYVGSHAREIEGWDYTESRRLLDGLLAEATGPEHVYAHAWRPGDLVIWDNRCLLHRGSGYDADRYRRYMRQTRVAGAGPTLAE
jgi:alpha-ketoglutarate-dependent 2,4-dichlorophenoxyacetate dioxygenase